MTDKLSQDNKELRQRRYDAFLKTQKEEEQYDADVIIDRIKKLEDTVAELLKQSKGSSVSQKKKTKEG